MRKSCEECIHIRVCSDTVTAADDCEDYISEDDVTPVKHGHWILLRESEITGFNPEFYRVKRRCKSVNKYYQQGREPNQ